MYHTYFKLYWLLLVITITATFGKKYQTKLFKDSFSEKRIHNNINKHEVEEPCGGHSIKTNSHQIKNYPKVIIN